MFVSFTLQMLAVVAPRSSIPPVEQHENPFLIPVVVMLTLLTIVALRPRRRRQDEREERTLDPRKDDYVLIQAGVYRVVKSASAGEGSVTLCVDKRQGHTILVEKAEIEGIVRPSIPPTAESHGELMSKVKV